MSTLLLAALHARVIEVATSPEDYCTNGAFSEDDHRYNLHFCLEWYAFSSSPPLHDTP
ncbi:hypothetical protein DAI22_06g167003 [Oryza sativa Japonica Group]|nr:hypothetical protein DAI22_06g167003 [Oryza sativa Japonica Group]